MKHTKGEWVIHGEIGKINIDCDKKGIANVLDYKDGECIYNARLISASPELLVACKEANKHINRCYRFAGNYNEPILKEIQEILQQAINKAEGK